jgi:hypothetical protein
MKDTGCTNPLSVGKQMPSGKEKEVEDGKERLRIIASQMNAASWIATERKEYADKKFDEEKRHKLDLDMKDFGLTEEGLWPVHITNYLKRAQLLGVDTPKGLQALGKFTVTAIAMFESAIRVYGKPPMPGVTSGEIFDWEQ